MLQAKFHIALIELADCERAYRRAGQIRGVTLCELDRAETFLALNLLEDARRAAISAERQFRRMGLSYETAKAALFRSKACHAMGLNTESKSALERARLSFRKQSNNGFSGAVELQTVLQAKTPIEANKSFSRARLHFRQAQLPLWEAICDLLAVVRGLDSPGALKRLANNRAAHAVPHLYAQWQTYLGDRAVEQGKLDVARSHWTRAADRLDAIRSSLPPIEIRSKFGRDMASPHLRLIHADPEHCPEEAAMWVERYKNSGLWSPLPSGGINSPERKRVESLLQALSEQVALIASQTRGVSGERGSAITTNRRTFSRLCTDVTRMFAEAEKPGANDLASAKLISDITFHLSKSYPIVQFHQSDNDLLAFVHEKGQTRIVRWSNGGRLVRTLAGRWRFHLESEILYKTRRTTDRMQNERKLFSWIGEELWKPLELSSAHDRVLIVPDGDLSNLPWGAVVVNGTPLLDAFQIVLTPSIRHHHRGKQTKTRSNKSEVFVNATGHLQHVGEEIQTMVQCNNSTVKIHNPAKRSDWPTSGSANFWHFAGHAHFRKDNPFYSYLEMSDGPLFAADFRLRQVRVNLVTLAACQSGEQIALPGAESTGIVRCLLEMGARNVVASHWPVLDESTSLWMSAFYSRYSAGATVQEAYRSAAQAVRDQFSSACHWAAFSVFGAGD